MHDLANKPIYDTSGSKLIPFGFNLLITEINGNPPKNRKEETFRFHMLGWFGSIDDNLCLRNWLVC